PLKNSSAPPSALSHRKGGSSAGATRSSTRASLVLRQKASRPSGFAKPRQAVNSGLASISTTHSPHAPTILSRQERSSIVASWRQRSTRRSKRYSRVAVRTTRAEIQGEVHRPSGILPLNPSTRAKGSPESSTKAQWPQAYAV